jgi:serine kinase of HPr protein (carbohydrate metabolism regulator)
MTERTVQVHATCVNLGQAGKPFRAPASAGILILGPSGAGKSDLALRLIANGATLVADDRTEVFVRRGALYAKPPARIAGLIEVRGVGVLSIPYTEEVRLALAVSLVRKVERLPRAEKYLPPRQLASIKSSCPLLRVIAEEASAPAKIAAAVAAFSRGGFRDFVKAE